MLSRRSPNSGKKKNALINCHCLHQASNLSAGRSLQLPASHRAPPPSSSAPAHHPIIGRTSSKRISTSCQRCFPSSCQARCGGRRAAPDVNDGLIKAPCVFTQRVSARPLAGRARGRQRTPRGHPLSLPTGLCTPLQKPTVG